MKKRHVEACLHPILRWWICPLTSLTAFQHNHGWMHVSSGKETLAFCLSTIINKIKYMLFSCIFYRSHENNECLQTRHDKKKERNKFIGLNADQRSSNMKNLGSICIWRVWARVFSYKKAIIIFSTHFFISIDFNLFLMATS